MPLVVIAVILALQNAPSLRAADKVDECPPTGASVSLLRTPGAEPSAIADYGTGAAPFRKAATELDASMADQVRSEGQSMESAELRWNDYQESIA